MLQGSTFRPVLFFLLINDIVRCSAKLNIIFYADDNNFFIQGRDLDNLQNIMNNELMYVVNCLESIKLSLNINITHYNYVVSPTHDCTTKEKLTLR